MTYHLPKSRLLHHLHILKLLSENTDLLRSPYASFTSSTSYTDQHLCTWLLNHDSPFHLKVYEQIAGHFSTTRHKPWPKVVQFMQGVSPGSVVMDLGCGNGKNILRRDDIVQVSRLLLFVAWVCRVAGISNGTLSVVILKHTYIYIYTYIHKLTPFSHVGRQKLQNANNSYIILNSLSVEIGREHPMASQFSFKSVPTLL